MTHQTLQYQMYLSWEDAKVCAAENARRRVNTIHRPKSDLNPGIAPCIGKSQCDPWEEQVKFWLQNQCSLPQAGWTGVFCSRDCGVEGRHSPSLANEVHTYGCANWGQPFPVGFPLLAQTEALTALLLCSNIEPPANTPLHQHSQWFISKNGLANNSFFLWMFAKMNQTIPNATGRCWFAFLYANQELQIIFGSLALAHSSEVTTEGTWGRWQLYNNNWIQADQALQKESCFYTEIINWRYLPWCTLRMVIR